MRLVSIFPLCLMCAAAALLTGCALTFTAPSSAPIAETGPALHGIVHGGQQPVVGAHVYLYAAGTGGYGGNGIAASSANASQSLLTSSVLTNNPGSSGMDASGNYYVTTSSGGFFSVNGDYACTSGQQLYLYAVGGNPGSGANSAAAFLAALGDCSTISSSTSVWVNEVSTIATAYALAGFATDATHISNSGTSLGQVGIKNAFATVTNLENLSTGVALAMTPAGNGTVPQGAIDTLANILASCVNTSSSSSSICTLLFANAMSASTTGMAPTDTATAAIYIAQNPGASVQRLFGLQAAVASPFLPDLSYQPNDLTLGIAFGPVGGYGLSNLAIDSAGNLWTAHGGSGYGTGRVFKYSNLGAPLSGASGFPATNLFTVGAIAVDKSGDLWVADSAVGNLEEFSPSGALLSGVNGFLGGGIVNPVALGIDGSGNVWTANSYNPGSVSEFNSSGQPISVSGGLFGAGLHGPVSIALDGSGNAWLGNNSPYATPDISEFSSYGGAISPTTGYTGGGLGINGIDGIAVDGFGNVWAATFYSSTISKFASSGSAISPSTGFTGGGLSEPRSISIDGAGNVWTANFGNGTVSLFSGSGVAISGGNGYTGQANLGANFSEPYVVAVDGSGNVWVANFNPSGYNTSSFNSMSELIGAAAPVVTPICAGLPQIETTGPSSNLGTRP